MNAITYSYLIITKPTQPFLPVVSLPIFICTLALFSFSTYSAQVCLIVSSGNFHSKDRNAWLGVSAHYMTVKLSNLSKTSVKKKKKAENFMDEEMQEMMNEINEDEDRELNKQLFWHILEKPSLYWEVLFILCAKIIYVEINFIERKIYMCALVCILCRYVW